MKCAKLKKAFHLSNGCRCYLCGEVFPLEKLHLEHVKPLSQSGRNSRENFATACIRCNLLKGPLDVRGFTEKLAKRIEFHQSELEYLTGVFNNLKGEQ